MEKIATISERLKAAMEYADTRQTELSQRTGIDRSAISSYLTGRYAPKQDNILKIARVLGVSEVWLMGYDVPMRKNTDLPADILPPPSTHRVPILGTIACGTPIEAVQNYDGEAFVPEDVRCDFALRCKGDSMKDARIHDGDLVYIRAQPQVESGQIAAVLIDGEATLKRVYYHTNSVVLMPANPAYDPIVLDPATADPDSVRVLGLAVAFTSVIV